MVVLLHLGEVMMVVLVDNLVIRDKQSLPQVEVVEKMVLPVEMVVQVVLRLQVLLKLVVLKDFLHYLEVLDMVAPVFGVVLLIPALPVKHLVQVDRDLIMLMVLKVVVLVE